MAQGSNRPARVANWRPAWFDRTADGQQGLARLEFLVGLTRPTIHRWLKAADARATAGTIFAEKWPTEVGALAISAKAAADLGLLPDIAAILGCTTATVRRTLAAVHGNTLIGRALAALITTRTGATANPPLQTKSPPRPQTVAAPLPKPGVRGDRSAGLQGTATLEWATTAPANSWAVGQRIGGKWHLIDQPKVGGFGAAWPALGPTGVRCWIKQPQPGASKRAAHRRELANLQRFSHENIVRLLDYSAIAADPWLVVEDAGTTLKDKIADGPLSIRQTIGWLRQAATALDYVHRQGMVIQDVNPGNLGMDAAGRVRLFDLGTVANLAPALNTVGQGTHVATTAIGHHFGFSAPETQKRQSRRASDQYGLAAMALAAIAGKPNGGVKPASIKAKLPTAVFQVFDRAMQASARDRFATCMAFVDALDAAERQR